MRRRYSPAMSELLFIGTGDAFGAGGRRQAGILLRGARGSALLDCGATTLTGLVQLGVERSEIDAVLISHFHADHFAGIPPLLLAAHHEDQRRTPLHVAGPPGTEAQVHRLADAMGYPLGGLEFGFDLRFHEFAPGDWQDFGPVRARSFPVHHAPDSRPHGFVVRDGAHQIAYSGDTGWFEALPRHVAGCDLFVCECTFHTPRMDTHFDETTLLDKQKLFDCGRLLTTHFGAAMAERRGRSELAMADDGLRLRL